MTTKVWTAIVNPVAVAAALGKKDKSFMKCGIAGINLRLPTSPSDSDAWAATRRLISTALECGIKYSVHSWVGSRNSEGISTADERQATLDAVSVAYMIHQLRKEVGASPRGYGINAERDVWRGPGGRANPLANAYLRRFGTLFSKLETGSELEYMGFADPDVHYTDSDVDHDGQQDDEIAEHVKALFGRVHVMAYQSKEAEIRTVIKRATTVWRAQEIGVFVGCGRIDKQLGTVGNESATKALALDNNIRELTYYVGNDAEKQLLVGHSGHASIYDIVSSMR